MTKRFYSGSRTAGGRMGEAAKLKRLELEKGGKLPISSTDRYKRIMKQKLADAKMDSSRSTSSFQMPGTKPVEKEMSKTTAQAMRMIAQRRAAKEEKELRQMVVVKPGILQAGRIDKKGQVYDLGNNVTLQVDAKTGKIKTKSGWTVGKYNARKKFKTNGLMDDALRKHGAYFIQQKKLALLQEQERFRLLNDDGGNAWNPGGGMASQQFLDEHYGGGTGGATREAHNRGSGVNAWGAMSNSVMGTHAENAWGGMVDNVWGGTDSNIWGGMGGSAWNTGGGVWKGPRGGGIFGKAIFGGGVFGGVSNYGRRGMKVFGSGKEGQKNFFKPLGGLLAGIPVIGKLVAPKARMRSR